MRSIEKEQIKKKFPVSIVIVFLFTFILVLGLFIYNKAYQTGVPTPTTTPAIILHIEPAGSLSSLIANSKKNQITNLTLTGDLNFYDMRYIMEMKKLNILNIANANLIGFMGSYMVHNSNKFSINDILNGSLISITLPDDVKLYDDFNAPFDNCYRLEKIIVSENNERYSVVEGVLFDKNKTTLIWYPKVGYSSYEIPNGVVTIGKAFQKCRNLTNLTLPTSIQNIDYEAFKYCNLKKLHLKNSIPPTLKYNLLDVNKQECTLYVPNGSHNVYWLAPGWGDFKRIVEE